MKIPLLRAKVHENRPINTIATREIPKIRNFIGEHCMMDFVCLRNMVGMESWESTSSAGL